MAAREEPSFDVVLTSLIFAQALQFSLAFDFRLPVLILFSSFGFQLVSKGLSVVIFWKEVMIPIGLYLGYEEP